MTFRECQDFLDKLTRDVLSSERVGDLTKNYLVGLIVCLRQYVPRLYRLMPMVIERDEDNYKI